MSRTSINAKTGSNPNNKDCLIIKKNHCGLWKCQLSVNRVRDLCKV